MFESCKVEKILIDNKRENVLEMLRGADGKRLFYLIVLSFVFQDYRSFEIRNDLILDKNDLNGDIIVCDDGNIIYFKNQDEELTNAQFKSILQICYKLQDKCGGNVDAYLFCSPEIEFRGYGGIERDGISIKLASLKSFDGDEAIRILDNKIKNNEEFSFVDHVFHLLLPYMNYADKDKFLFKYQRYMMSVMISNAEKQGYEFVRLFE